jgi:predicted metal-dependent hydrolase
LDLESHYVWGERYLLNLVERDQTPTVTLTPQKLSITVRPGSSREVIEEILQDWYRDQLRSELPDLINKWEAILNVKVERIFVQKMKTKWGSCNPDDKSIRLNTELAKKPREYLEYVLVHEMMHLLHPGHGPEFIRLMDTYLPNWRYMRNELNALAKPEWKELVI